MFLSDYRFMSNEAPLSGRVAGRGHSSTTWTPAGAGFRFSKYVRSRGLEQGMCDLAYSHLDNISRGRGTIPREGGDCLPT